MISGSLAQKSGYWYAILNLKDNEGKRKQKWISTHLPVKGNKKRAEEILTKLRIEYTTLEDINHNSHGVLFYEYMAAWIADMNGKVAPSTYNGYKNIVQNSVCPYYRSAAMTGAQYDIHNWGFVYSSRICHKTKQRRHNQKNLKFEKKDFYE